MKLSTLKIQSSMVTRKGRNIKKLPQSPRLTNRQTYYKVASQLRLIYIQLSFCKINKSYFHNPYIRYLFVFIFGVDYHFSGNKEITLCIQ